MAVVLQPFCPGDRAVLAPTYHKYIRKLALNLFLSEKQRKVINESSAIEIICSLAAIEIYEHTTSYMGSSVSSPHGHYFKKRRKHRSSSRLSSFHDRSIREVEPEEATDTADLKDNCEIATLEKSQPEFPIEQRRLVVETWAQVEDHIAQVSFMHIDPQGRHMSCVILDNNHFSPIRHISK